MTTAQVKKTEGQKIIDMFANLSEKKQQILFGFALGLETNAKLEPPLDKDKSRPDAS